MHVLEFTFLVKVFLAQDSHILSIKANSNYDNTLMNKTEYKIDNMIFKVDIFMVRGYSRLLFNRKYIIRVLKRIGYTQEYMLTGTCHSFWLRHNE